MSKARIVGRAHSWLAGALLFVLFTVPAGAQQAQSAWTRSPASTRSAEKPEPAGRPLLVPPTRVTVVESEPNNTPATADLAALGDTVSGVLGDTLDLDVFAIDLTAGTVIDFDVDAQVFGSTLDAFLVLYDVDGVTPLAVNDDYDGLDSRIVGFQVPATGRYYLEISDYWFDGGPTYTYRIRLNQVAPGPGDPTTVRATGADAAWTIAAGPTGQAYVLDWFDGQIWRVPPTGTPTLVASTVGFDMVLDGFGDLLVVQPDSGNIMRVAVANGARTRFAETPGFEPFSITVDGQGDVWVFAVSDTESTLIRFSPHGAERSRINADAVGFALKMAFSQTGALHLSTGFDAIYRLNAGNTFSLVFQSDHGVGGMTFDTQNNMYVSTPGFGVLKVGSSYQLLADPFALSNLDLSGNTAFLRDASGNMTSRLVATNLGTTDALAGLLVEMNPAGVTAPGIRIGTDLESFTISVAQAAEHLLVGGVLDAAEEEFLDGRGNGNDQFDVGDLRAMLHPASGATSDDETD